MLTGLLLGARLAAVAPLSDPTGRQVPPGVHLSIPWLYAILAPLFTLWDGISMLSMSRLHGFLLGLALLYLAWRVVRGVRRPYARTAARLSRRSLLHELQTLLVSLTGFLMFLLAGALWHRPMLALAGAGPDTIVTDFHSHTNVSHDVRNTLMRDYDLDANLAWHRRAGFDADFITDHNAVAALRPRQGLPAPCPGTEVSAWKAHIVLLGDSLPVNQGRYNGSLTGLELLLRTSDTTYGALSVGSLPEYERNHWERLPSLIADGMDGLEIVNAAPKANELSRERRDSVIALARQADRFVVGVNDSHGWGATSMVWNLVSAPRWRATGANPCPLVLRQLRRGFSAVQVLERHRLRADSAWPMILTPIGVVWETWRSMGWALTLSWLVWIWGVWSIAAWRRARG